MPQPLFHKRIVITRDPEQAGELARALESLGAEVILLPAVAFAPAIDTTSLDDLLRRIDDFEWILFTSRNAVRFFSERLRLLHGEGRARTLKAAAVGPATAETAIKDGFLVQYVAKTNTGESLAVELRESLGGRSVLLPRSDRADDRLPDALRNAGAHVTEIVAYRTTAPVLDPALLDCIRGGEVDAVAFASPSAFRNLRDAVGAGELARLSERVAFAAIGPTTARAIRDSGARVAIESEAPSASAVAHALANYFQTHAVKRA